MRFPSPHFFCSGVVGHIRIPSGRGRSDAAERRTARAGRREWAVPPAAVQEVGEEVRQC